MNLCSCWNRVSREQTRFLSSLETRFYYILLLRYSQDQCFRGRRYGDILHEWFLNFLSTHRPHFPKDVLFTWTWTCDWSHDNLNDLKAGDKPTKQLFQTMKAHGDLDNGILVFLSDHGYRHGSMYSLELNKSACRWQNHALLPKSQYCWATLKHMPWKQGRIHGHQLRTGGQGRICAFSHFSTCVHGPKDRPTNQPTNRPTDGRTKPLIELLVRD